MRTGRGSYRKSYIVPHGNGFKYLRRVPEDIQHVENRRAWVKCLGSVSRLEAETLAHGLAHEHGKRILTLRAVGRGEPLILPLVRPEPQNGAPFTAPPMCANGEPSAVARNLRDGRRPPWPAPLNRSQVDRANPAISNLD